MKKRHTVVYLEDILENMKADSDLPVSEFALDYVVDKLLHEIKANLLDEKIVDIKGNRLVVSHRKLNPKMGTTETYKISTSLSGRLKEEITRKFSSTDE